MKRRLAVMAALTVLASAMFALTIRAQQPVVKTDKSVYSKNDPITVQFSGLAGNQTDWITVVDASWKDSDHGSQWAYTKGQRDGLMKFVAANPGTFEVRVYYNYPSGGTIVQTRVKFVVTDPTGDPATTKTPAAIPSRPLDVPASSPTVSSTPQSTKRQDVNTDFSNASTASRDSEAEDLAKATLGRGEKADRSLRKAILLAGFAIREADGKIVRVARPGQGLIIQYWEIEEMLRMSKAEMTMPFADLSGMLAVVAPNLERKVVEDLIVKDLRGNGDSMIPTKRFWARFIIELGRHSAQQYDLRGNVELSKVRIDPIQSALILLRIAGDLHSTPLSTKGVPSSNVPGGNGSHGYQYNRTRPLPAFDSNNGKLVNVAVLRDHRWPLLNFPQKPPAMNPCNLDLGIFDGDFFAVGFGYGFGQVLERLADAGHLGAEVMGKRLAATNLILAYVKLIWIVKAGQAEIKMEGDGPLIRTTNRTPGERRQLSAALSMNSGKWENVNCVRLALNNVGLDFDVPADGPVKEADLDWVLVEGGEKTNTKGDYSITRAIVEIENSGPRIQDAGAGAGNIKDFVRTKVDEEGIGHVWVRGAAQREVLVPPLTPVMKEFKVRVDIQLEPPRIWNSVWKGLGIFVDPFAVFALPPDLVYRSHWLSSQTTPFPVRDWEQCKPGEWRGTITYTRRLLNTHSRTERGVGRITRVDVVQTVKKEDHNESIQITGGKSDILLEAISTATFTGGWLEDKMARWEDECPKSQGGGTRKVSEHFVFQKIETVEKTGVATVSIRMDPSGAYVIQFKTPSATAKGEQTSATTISNDCNPANNGTVGGDPYPYSNDRAAGVSASVRGITRDPNVVKGSETRADGSGKIVITWDLKHCN